LLLDHPVVVSSKEYATIGSVSGFLQRAIDALKREFASGKYLWAVFTARPFHVSGDELMRILELAYAKYQQLTHPRRFKNVPSDVAQRFLEGCYLYTTYEPCPMCTSAAIWAKLQGIVFGASLSDQTPQCPQRIAISAKMIIQHGHPMLEIVPNFMQAECAKLLHL
jgi:tRNA(Arg) A34 adenosine deaminase TadA